jgi:periplasmic copper chaperone A
MMRLRGLVGVALFAIGASALAVAPAPAALHARHPWIRWLPANLPAGGYVVIENDGSAPARLVGASSPDYGMVMLHRSQEVHGVDVMTAVSGIDVPAHGSAKLAPGGYHLMFMKPAHPVKPGDMVPVTLRFARGGALQVAFPVRPANAVGPDG